jgi:hypothetical protein
MTPFAKVMLAAPRPDRVRTILPPRRENYAPSPVDWQDEVLYFIVVDRFSDGAEGQRPLLDRSRLREARGEGWTFSAWAESGSNRWQGGTLRGVISKLDYLQRLGITALWLSSVFKQRGHEDTYHGYAVQDFLDVDPHFGSRADLAELVAEAHARGMRVLLDIVFQHSGTNWLYPPDTPGGPLHPRYTSGRYPFGAWLGEDGRPIASGQPSCKTKIATRGPVRANSGLAISTIRMPSTSAPIFPRCATSSWTTRGCSTTWPAVSSTGSCSPTSMVSVSTP